jgi:predicted ferric reductase
MTASSATRRGDPAAAPVSPSIGPRDLLLALAGGAATGVFVLLVLRANPGATLLGAEPKGFWYLSRASALASFALLWLATALGLLITNKLARLWPGGPLAFDLHQYASGLGLLVGLAHAALLLADRYIGYTPAQLLIPFGGGSYRPLWVGLGQIGAYLLVGLWGSSLLRLRIGQRWWRRIHFLSFLAFLLVLLHGLLAGTDSEAIGVRALYWLSGGSILWLTAYRILRARPVQRPGGLEGGGSRGEPPSAMDRR